MNPIPLSSPDGRVYAYACGVCHNVVGVAFVVGPLRPGPSECDVEESKRRAEACCRCDRCGHQLTGEIVFGLPVCDVCKPIREAEWKAHQNNVAAIDATYDAKFAASLAKSKHPEAANQLLRIMRDISEDRFCAGWLAGLEFRLWEAIGSEAPEDAFVDETDILHLRVYHMECDGWWVWWHDEASPAQGPVFVTYDEWNTIYAAQCEGR